MFWDRSIEEDYREIGVMKAIGIHSRDIRRLYLTKYVVMAAAACVCGYVLSLFVGGIFTQNITLYMGNAEKTLRSALLPFVGAGMVFAAVAVFCRLILRKFRRISAVEALRSGRSNDKGKLARGIKLRSSSFPNVNVFLGIREVLGRFKIYGLLCFVFIVCAFLMIVPLNFLNTVESPAFISYMGAVLLMTDGVIAGEKQLDKYRSENGDIRTRENQLYAWLSGMGF